MDTNLIRTVVVGVASTDADDPLVELGVRMAESVGATLHLVHAFTLPEPMLQPYAELEWLNPQNVEQHRNALAQRLSARVQRFSPSVPVHCHVLPGPSATVLAAVADETAADLVVVGATRRGTLSRTILGTTAQRVLRGTRVPTLVVRDPFPIPVKRVLLTTDLSPLSAAVHTRGAELATRLFGEIEAMRSVLVVGYEVSTPPPLRTDLVHAAAAAEMRAFLDECDAPGRAIEARVRIGEASGEIVSEAADWPADLLILGTHGRSGTQRFLLGSVAEATVRSALCSVLVIPALAVGVDPDDEMPRPVAVRAHV
jgi:nucleotide-binding universal stress UspA family protein